MIPYYNNAYLSRNSESRVYNEAKQKNKILLQ